FYFLYFSIVSSSHGILDAFTNGGLGIALLSPFDNERYFFPATPIYVSPLSVKEFISEKGIAILKNEILWVWVPSIFVAIIGKTNYTHNAYKKLE
ncbi:MAG: metal-dependent hydrolase, partial [Desulfobacterales bacterium]|nr:metal-dependent hydrolase [Desulfobacterales bacterium]